MSDRRSGYRRRSGAITKALNSVAAAAPSTSPSTSPSAAPARQRFYAPATPEEGAALLIELEDEATFQRWVISVASERGWFVFHPYDSRRNVEGYPDLTMFRGNRLIVAELKTERGRLSPAQLEVMAALFSVAEASNGAVTAAIWRPSDRAIIERILA